MSYELKDYMDNAAGVFYKNPSIPDEVLKYREPVDPAELLAGLTLEKLNNIYQSILKKQESKIDPIRSKFGTIEKEEVSLSDKMLAMKSYAAEHRKFSFRQLLTSQSSRVQVIVTFLSILELMKMGYIHVQQDELFDDIQVDVTQHRGHSVPAGCAPFSRNKRRECHSGHGWRQGSCHSRFPLCRHHKELSCACLHTPLERCNGA